MTNFIKVSLQETIYNLYDRGWSNRRIARELKINRETVARYLALRSNPAISTPGFLEQTQPKCTDSTSGSKGAIDLKPAISTSGKSGGRKSLCVTFEGVINAKLELGLKAQRIYQDLVHENGFLGSYQAVKRFVRKLRATEPQRVFRMECQPGEEMQVDFGLGAPIEDRQTGKTRRSWVFRAVLSFSRKGYSEAVFYQNTETFIRVLENAIRAFGGVPLMLNLDNLKAAVLKADWFDPELNPKLADFCRHYRINVVPCRPRTPQHKGKVERGVAYVCGNALKGKKFNALAEENFHLAWWESNIADQRIHGTTCKQVAASFELERPYLQPLPVSLFPCYQEARRNVHRDSYVEVQRSFYEAPPEYIGRQVWVRWDGRCVQIFNDRMEQLQIHTRIEPGKFSRCLGAGGFSAPVRSSCKYWVNRAAVLGERCGEWAQSAVDVRGPEALRSVMALCGLIKTHSASSLNTACAKAIKNGTYRLKDIKRLLGEKTVQGDFSFAESHPLIRDLNVYRDFINQQKNYDPYHQTTGPEPTSFGIN